MADQWACSRCPILDLGVKLEPGDWRDPWRRMPKLFRLAHGLFGGGMMNHRGRTRVQLEARMAHYCAVMRQRHGLCTGARIGLCQGAMAEVFRDAGREGVSPWPMVQYGITELVRSESHHAVMRSTRVDVDHPPAAERMPPALERMPVSA